MKNINNLYAVYHDVIECLTGALEARDTYTKGHSDRVSNIAKKIALGLGFDDERTELTHIAAHLHDIGKIGIPDDILYKAGRLTNEEYEIIKRHSQIGHDILYKSDSLRGIAKIVLHHHEAFDGSGYPLGLVGEDIPLESRILAITDSIDAMTSERPYRKPLTILECKEELIRCSGTQFDPKVVECVIRLWDSIYDELFTVLAS